MVLYIEFGKEKNEIKKSYQTSDGEASQFCTPQHALDNDTSRENISCSSSINNPIWNGSQESCSFLMLAVLTL